MKKVRILRITTVPMSLKILLKGQMNFISKNGFEVLMCSSGGECIDEIVEYEQCPHKIIPLKRTISPLSNLDVLWKLIKVIKEFKPDIVHTHSPKAGLIGMMAAWLTKTPIRLHIVAGIPAMESKGLKIFFYCFLKS